MKDDHCTVLQYTFVYYCLLYYLKHKYTTARVATVFLQEFQQQWRTIIPLCFSIHLSTILYCIVWNTSTLPPALLQFSCRSFNNNKGRSFHCASVYICQPFSTVLFETQVHYRQRCYSFPAGVSATMKDDHCTVLQYTFVYHSLLYRLKLKYTTARVATVFLQEFQQQWRTIIAPCFSMHLSTIVYCIIWNTSTLPPALLQFSCRSFANSEGRSFHCASVYICLPLSNALFETQVHYRPHCYSFPAGVSATIKDDHSTVLQYTHVYHCIRYSLKHTYTTARICICQFALKTRLKRR